MNLIQNRIDYNFLFLSFALEEKYTLEISRQEIHPRYISKLITGNLVKSQFKQQLTKSTYNIQISRCTIRANATARNHSSLQNILQKTTACFKFSHTTHAVHVFVVSVYGEHLPNPSCCVPIMLRRAPGKDSALKPTLRVTELNKDRHVDQNSIR